jgi:hypothetical protein
MPLATEIITQPEIIPPGQQDALVLVESTKPVQLFTPGFIDPLLTQFKEQVRAEAAKLDISREKDRKSIASLAHKIARAKTGIDGKRKELVKDEKERLKKIDAEGSRIWDELENLQKEVRQPLTDWEDAEKRRIAGHEATISNIQDYIPYVNQHWQTLPIEEMRGLLTKLSEVYDWQEFTQRAALAISQAETAIKEAIAKREKYDADQAELKRLQEEAAAREQKEREERIVREAKERAEAEAREREEQARRESEAELQRIEQEAREREESERAAKEKAIREKLKAEAAAAKAEADRKAAAEKAEAERKQRLQSRCDAIRAAGTIDPSLTKVEIQARILQVEQEDPATMQEYTDQAQSLLDVALKNLRAVLAGIEEQERLAAEERARRDAEEAARKAREEADAAVQRERERLEQEHREAEEAERKREANRRHCAKINREALAALVAAGIDEAVGRSVIELIAKKTVPHVEIHY